MSVRREFDDDDEVEALRYDLETLASQARVDAVVTESFAAALERRLMSHAPRVMVSTGGAAAREAPAQLDKDDSDSSVDEDDDSDSSVVEGDDVSVEEADDVSVEAAEEAGDTKGDGSKLSMDEIDAIFLRNDEIRDEIETIKRILKRGLSTDDLHHVVGREKELLAELREMRRKLNV